MISTTTPNVGYLSNGLLRTFQERLQALEDGFFDWLLPGKGRSSASVLHTTADFPHLAYFVLTSEEERPAARSLWKQVLKELGRDEVATADEAVRRAAEKLELPSVDVNLLPIYRFSNCVVLLKLFAFNNVILCADGPAS